MGWLPLGPGAAAYFATRQGGVSAPPYAERNLAFHVGDDPDAVRRNRAALAADTGTDAARTTWMRQVHGTAVVVVTEVGADDAPEADALVTAVRGAPLAVLTADCVPLLLADGTAGVAAAVHAGWRGLADGVVEAAVAAMKDLGARTRETTAMLGACIGPCCYEVGEDVRDIVAARYADARATTDRGAPALDLPAGVAQALDRLGVRAPGWRGGCTAHQADRWFSYRRDGVTGRQASLVVLR